MSCHPGSYERSKTSFWRALGESAAGRGQGPRVAPGPEGSAAQMAGGRGPSEGRRHPARPKPWGPPPGPPHSRGVCTLSPPLPTPPAQPAPRLPSPGGGQGPPLVLTPTRQPVKPRSGRPRSEPRPGRPGPSGSPQAVPVASASTASPATAATSRRQAPPLGLDTRAQALSRVRLFVPQGLGPLGLLCPQDAPGKDPGVGCRGLLRGLSDPGLLRLLH